MGVVPVSGMATEPMRRHLTEILKGDFALIEKPLRKESFKTAFAKAWNYWSPPLPEAPQWEAGGRTLMEFGVIRQIKSRCSCRKAQTSAKATDFV